MKNPSSDQTGINMYMVDRGIAMKADITMKASPHVKLKRSGTTAKFVRKGGPGSGFDGHAGRPGKVGGSSSNYTRVRINTTDGIKTMWAKHIIKEGMHYFTKVTKAGIYPSDESLEIYVVTEQDIIWKKDAIMNLHYGELELKEANKAIIHTKGGPGSGHRGHKGRPGKVGGGLPDNAAVAETPKPKKKPSDYPFEEDLKYSHDDLQQGVEEEEGLAYILLHNGGYIDVHDFRGGDYNTHPTLLEDNEDVARHIWTKDFQIKGDAMWVREWKVSGEEFTSIATHIMDTSTLRKIQRAWDDGKIEFLNNTVEWSDDAGFRVSTTTEELLSAKYAVDGELKEVKTAIIHTKGNEE